MAARHSQPGAVPCGSSPPLTSTDGDTCFSASSRRQRRVPDGLTAAAESAVLLQAAVPESRFPCVQSATLFMHGVLARGERYEHRSATIISIFDAQGWRYQYDSKNRTGAGGLRSTRARGIECLSCDEPLEPDSEICGAHAAELRNSGQHLRCFARFDRHGNRSARIPAHRELRLLTSLHGREEPDRN